MTLGREPGAPFPLSPAPPETIIADVGDVDADDGVRLVLAGDILFFSAAIAGGQRIELGISIHQIFEAIQAQNKVSGS